MVKSRKGNDNENYMEFHSQSVKIKSGKSQDYNNVQESIKNSTVEITKKSTTGVQSINESVRI